MKASLSIKGVNFLVNVVKWDTDSLTFFQKTWWDVHTVLLKSLGNGADYVTDSGGLVIEDSSPTLVQQNSDTVSESYDIYRDSQTGH